VLVSAESAPPKTVAKNDDLGTILEIVGLAKSATEQDRGSEQAEVIRCDVEAMDLFRGSGCKAHLGLVEVICGNLLHRIHSL
jgi:hypothetical protein